MSARLWRSVRLCFSLVLCLLLGACGLHFEGRGGLPHGLERVYVVYKSPYSVIPDPILQDVKQVLRRHGVQLVSTPKQAQAILTLRPAQRGTRVLSVDANGLAESYTLIEREHYEFHIKATNRTVKQSVAASQDYSYSGRVALAKQEEAKRLRRAMQHNIAERIYFRLRAAVDTQAAKAAAGGSPRGKRQ